MTQLIFYFHIDLEHQVSSYISKFIHHVLDSIVFVFYFLVQNSATSEVFQTWHILKGCVLLVALEKPIMENTRQRVKQNTTQRTHKCIVFVCKNNFYFLNFL